MIVHHFLFKSIFLEIELTIEDFRIYQNSVDHIQLDFLTQLRIEYLGHQQFIQLVLISISVDLLLSHLI